MPAKHNVLAVILGGGAGTRLFPLTQQRSKPAVPLGGKYRLVDIAISNCINSDVFKMFVLTQYNSASLNRHLAQTYRFSQFSNGFVEVMAAEQTPESPHWFQGTADAVASDPAAPCRLGNRYAADTFRRSSLPHGLSPIPQAALGQRC